MNPRKTSKSNLFLSKGYAEPVFPKWLRYPKKINVCEELLDRNLRRGFGSRTAIRFSSRSISYIELSRMVKNYSNYLSSIGVGKQDRIIIRTTNVPEFIIALLSIIRIGAIAVPTHPLYSQEEIDFVAKDSRARFGIGTGTFVDELRNAGPYAIGISQDSLRSHSEETQNDISSTKVGSQSPCLILYTSGTTGIPKGCIHTHSDYLAVSDIYGGKVLNVNSQDIITSPTSLSFAFGHIGMIAIPFRFGAAVSLFNLKFDASEFLSHIINEKSTILFAVPSAYRAMLKLPRTPEVDKFSASIRICVSAGEPCGAELAENWERKFKVKILEHLGSTEMLDGFVGTTLNDLKKDPSGSLGYPFPGYHMKFKGTPHYDKERKMKIGEALVRGPVTIRYWNRPREQREVTLRRWNRTSDILGLDSTGRYWYISRSDDIIKSAGYRISPHEVERVIMQHPKVIEVAVIGVPDRDRGKIVAAILVIGSPKEGYQLDAQEISRFAKEHLASYKVPRIFKIATELPKTSTGKINKALLQRELDSLPQL